MKRVSSSTSDTTALTRQIRWKEVMADQPRILRDAGIGAGMVLVGGLYFVWMSIGLPLDLPAEWRDLGTAVEIVSGITGVVASMFIVLGAFLVTQPLTERRGLRVRLFAADNGLEYRAAVVHDKRVVLRLNSRSTTRRQLG